MVLQDILVGSLTESSVLDAEKYAKLCVVVDEMMGQVINSVKVKIITRVIARARVRYRIRARVRVKN